MRKARALGCLCLVLLSLPISASGQAVYGNVVGTVVDPSGAAVANAKVIISDTSRAISFTTTTNESGFFTQRFLIAGTYQVRVEAEQLPRIRAGRERVGRPGNQSGHQAAAGRLDRDGRGHGRDPAVENRAQRRRDHLQ